MEQLTVIDSYHKIKYCFYNPQKYCAVTLSRYTKIDINIVKDVLKRLISEKFIVYAYTQRGKKYYKRF